MEKIDLSPVEWCLRRMVAERPLNFEPSRESGLGKEFGGQTRDQALISLFYLPGYEWRAGGLARVGEIKKEKDASSWIEKQWRELFAPTRWKDPLEILGEENVDAFLSKNPAARAFTAALERSLTMGKAKPQEARGIVRAAAEKMYPDYVKNVRSLSDQLQLSVMVKGEAKLDRLPTPAESSPLMNIPGYLLPEWAAAVSEALALTDKVDRSKLAPEQKEELDKQAKWAERTLRSVRKGQLKKGLKKEALGDESSIAKKDAESSVKPIKKDAERSDAKQARGKAGPQGTKRA